MINRQKGIHVQRNALADRLAGVAMKVLGAIDPADARGARHLAIAAGILLDALEVVDRQILTDLDRSDPDALLGQLRAEMIADGIDLDSLDDGEEELLSNGRDFA